jgi:hypothetical protein
LRRLCRPKALPPWGRDQRDQQDQLAAALDPALTEADVV